MAECDLNLTPLPRTRLGRLRPSAALLSRAQILDMRWLYVASFFDQDRPTKIGISADPLRRCVGARLTLFDSFEAPDGGMAFRLEQTAHDLLWAYARRRGLEEAADAEWHPFPRTTVARYLRRLVMSL